LQLRFYWHIVLKIQYEFSITVVLLEWQLLVSMEFSEQIPHGC
jgi:hypothetical protein